MALRVATLLSVLVAFTLPHPLLAQTRTYAHQLTLLTPPDPLARKISVVVQPGLVSNASLPDDLKRARTEMHAGGAISAGALRALADRGDGLAAQKYVHLLLPDPAATPSDIAYYATIAVRTGRIWTLPEAIAAMHLLDPATEPAGRKQAYVSMLYPHAWAGNSLALDAVIDLNGDGRLFGALSEETRVRIVQQDARNGDGRAVMRMALILLSQSSRTAAEEALVQDYLTRAAAVDHLAISVTATNILALRKTPGGAAVISQ